MPFDKQTQEVCTAKKPLHCYECVWVCVFVFFMCNLQQSFFKKRCKLQAPKTTHRVVLFRLLQHVPSVTLLVTASLQSGLQMHTWARQPTHIYACAPHTHVKAGNKKQKGKKNAFCFSTPNHIRIWHKHPTLQTCCNE